MDPITAQRLGLPAPEEPHDPASNSTQKIDVSGQINGDDGSIRLDELGPMVVNSDGTLSRIANWQQMTEAERERTLRVLTARNKIRLANEAKKQSEGVQSE